MVKKTYSGVDVIIGGPPCQGFSTANRYQKETDDPRNKLFFQYIRFVEVLKPKVVLIENVRGILTRDNGYAKERITTLLKEQGYELNMQVLDASEYGVPQNRKRAIMVGIRQDFLEQIFDFDKLRKQKKVTIYEALSDLYGEENDLMNSCRIEPAATCPSPTTSASSSKAKPTKKTKTPKTSSSPSKNKAPSATPTTKPSAKKSKATSKAAALRSR